MSTRISKLVLRNFKSFRKAEFPLTDGFTVIAGANGTGKSNILDAVLFGLGITSMKLMRAKKLSDLVNHAAEDNTAKVEITLKNSEKTYEIARTIDKQGRSVYRLQGKQSALNEIASLLQQLGISPNGYNIVVQGDVTRIIEMSAEERRTIIDDVAGLSEFALKKEEALKELEKVEQKIREVRIVLNEREAYLQELLKERELAEKYNSLQRMLKETKATIISYALEEAKGSLQRGAGKIAEIAKGKDALQKERLTYDDEETKLRARQQEAELQLSAIRQKTYEGLGKDASEIQSEIRVCEGRIASLQDANARLIEKKNSIGERLAEIGRGLSEREGILKENEIGADALKKRISEAEKEKERNAGRNSEIPKRLAKAEADLGSTQKQLLEMHKELLAKKSGHVLLNGEIEILQKEIERLGSSAELKKISGKLTLIRDFSEKLRKISANLRKLWDKIGKSKVQEARLAADEIRGICEMTEALHSELDELLRAVSQISADGQISALSKAKNAKAYLIREMIAGEQKAAKEFAKLGEKQKLLEGEVSSLRKGNAQISSAEGHEKIIGLNKQLHSALQSVTKAKAESSEMEKREAELKSDKAIIENELEISKKGIEDEQQNIRQHNAKLSGMQAEIRKIELQGKEYEEDKIRVEKALNALLSKKLSYESRLAEFDRRINEINLEHSKYEVHAADLENELRDYPGIEIIKNANIEKLRSSLPTIENGIMQLGAINMKALAQYDSYKKEVDEVREKSNVLEQERTAVLDMIDKIDVKRNEAFMGCYEKVSGHFSKIFFNFLEGEGKLGLTNPSDPLNSGLLIEARHKAVKFSNIDIMSGGEKSLTALAFLFAIQLYESAPFYFFDEADAALDKENSEKLMRMIMDISRESQFIAITHNDSLIRNADQIIGVALNEQKSSVIGLKLKEKLENSAG
ncbi:MAG: AAA family ATPase [Candidatus Diapherotrites archaeon]|nr:AAA family ATPase [Candidatus Diapherotrites archaeon]